MIFDRGDRFEEKQKDDVRSFIVLPSVVSNRGSVKIVDNWRVSATSLQKTSPSTSPLRGDKIDSSAVSLVFRQDAHDFVVGGDSPGPLAYNANRSTLSTKGGALSQTPKYHGFEIRHAESAAQPGPADYYQPRTLVSPSHNALINRNKDTSNGKSPSSAVTQSSKRPDQQHRRLRSVSAAATDDEDAGIVKIAANPVAQHLQDILTAKHPVTSSAEDRRFLRTSLCDMLNGISPTLSPPIALKTSNNIVKTTATTAKSTTKTSNPEKSAPTKLPRRPIEEKKPAHQTSPIIQNAKNATISIPTTSNTANIDGQQESTTSAKEDAQISDYHTPVQVQPKSGMIMSTTSDHGIEKSYDSHMTSSSVTDSQQSSNVSETSRHNNTMSGGNVAPSTQSEFTSLDDNTSMEHVNSMPFSTSFVELSDRNSYCHDSEEVVRPMTSSTSSASLVILPLATEDGFTSPPSPISGNIIVSPSAGIQVRHGIIMPASSPLQQPLPPVMDKSPISSLQRSGTKNRTNSFRSALLETQESTSMKPKEQSRFTFQNYDDDSNKEGHVSYYHDDDENSVSNNHEQGGFENIRKEFQAPPSTPLEPLSQPVASSTSTSTFTNVLSTTLLDKPLSPHHSCSRHNSTVLVDMSDIPCAIAVEEVKDQETPPPMEELTSLQTPFSTQNKHYSSSFHSKNIEEDEEEEDMDTAEMVIDDEYQQHEQHRLFALAQTADDDTNLSDHHSSTPNSASHGTTNSVKYNIVVPVSSPVYPLSRAVSFHTHPVTISPSKLNTEEDTKSTSTSSDNISTHDENDESLLAVSESTAVEDMRWRFVRQQAKESLRMNNSSVNLQASEGEIVTAQKYALVEIQCMVEEIVFASIQNVLQTIYN